MSKHNPFEWVHSEFAYILTLFMATGAYLLKTEATLTIYLEFLIGLNGLFWLKQYGKNKTTQETQVKLASIGASNAKAFSGSADRMSSTVSDVSAGQQKD